MIAAKLAQVEWLKVRRRVAFWVATLFFAALLVVTLGGNHYANSRLGDQYRYRSAWQEALSTAEGGGLLIMLVLIVLLTASEKAWRTERQNVIDGLSRQQYFAGKVILLVGATVLLWMIVVTAGAVFEMLNRSLAPAVDAPFISRFQLLQLGVMLLFLFFIGAVGLMFGTMASSSGAALALAFLFMMLQAPITMIMARQGGIWHEATAYLPMAVLQSLTSRIAWDAEAFAIQLERMRTNGFPLMLSGASAVAVAAVYSALMCSVAFLSLRRRDL